MDDRVAQVCELARRLGDPQSAEGRAWRALAVDEGRLSPAMADRVVSVTTARYDEASVRALADGSLVGRRVAVVLAASVATAPLRAAVLPWLAGAASVALRPSRRQPSLARHVVETLGVGALREVDAVPEDVDHVIAYGSDETLARIRAALPEGVSFAGYGHGFGVAWVSLTGTDDIADVARAVAMDVSLYDQHGCLSPQTVFVMGDARRFAEALHGALAVIERELPRGKMEAADGARVVQWQGQMAVRASWFRRGATHSVGLIDRAEVVGSPGDRNITVARVEAIKALTRALEPHAEYITVVGAHDPRGGARWPEAMRARVVATGTMQDPPLDGPEDARGRIAVKRRRV